MTEDVVVLGSGYAGTGTVLSLEERLDGEADLTWVSDVDHHLVLHEAHRVIRDPSIRDRIRYPVSEIKSPSTRFVQGRVEDVDVHDRTVGLVDGSTVDYDYLVVGFGSRTAFFGIEGLDNVFPNNDPVVQAKLRKLLEARDVNIMTGEFIGEVDEDTVYIGEETELGYDVLLWTGGITGQDPASACEVEQDERSHRLNCECTFRTSDPRVFALGDAALVEQDERVAPPTAQAAWQAAEVAGENVARAIRGQPMTEWTHEDKGTLISVGDEAVAHDVVGLRNVVETFGGPAAETLKKTVAARWINTVAGPVAAARAFPDM